MQKRMRLQIRGGAFNPSAPTPKMVQRIKAVVANLPDGIMLPTRDMAAEVGTLVGSFDGHTAHPLLKDFKEADIENGHRNLWGNKATIAEFRFMKWYHSLPDEGGEKIPFDKLDDSQLSKLRKEYGRTQNGKNKSN